MDLYNAWEFLRYVASLSDRERARAGYSLVEADLMFALAMLWVLPLASPSNLTGLRYLSKRKIENLLDSVVKDELAGCDLMGHSDGEQYRYFLRSDGVSKAMSYWEVDMEWQVQNATLKLLHDSLPITEMINNILPRLWRTKAVKTPTILSLGPPEQPILMTVDENTQLCRHIYIRAYRRLAHSFTAYRTPDGYRFWVPTVGVGLVADADQKINSLPDLYAGLQTESSIRNGEKAAPPGAVFLVPDLLAGIDVTMQLAKNIPKAVITANGEVIEQLTPAAPVGYLHMPTERPNPTQDGESFRVWLQHPGRGATYGLTAELGISSDRS